MTTFDPKKLSADDFAKAYPGWHVGPNGEKKVFNHPDEVPEGWAHKRLGRPVAGKPEKPASEKEKAPEKTALDELNERFGEKSRDDIKEALKSLDIEFKGNAKTEDLAAQLLTALDEAESEEPEDEGSGDGDDGADDN